MIQRYSLRTKLLAGFSAVVLLMVGLGVYLITNIKSTDTSYSNMVTNNVVPVESAGRARTYMWRIKANLGMLIDEHDPSARAVLKKDIDDSKSGFKTEVDTIKSTQLPEEKPWLDDLDKNWAATLTAYDNVAALSDAGKTEQATGALHAADSTFLVARDALAKDFDFNTTQQNKINANNTKMTKRSVVLAYIVLGFASAMGLVLAWLIARHIGAAVRRSSENMDISAESLSAVAEQMSANAEETAAQTQVVAATIEEFTANMSSVAAAVEEMEVTVREIAENATSASQVAANAVSTVENTNQQVAALGESSNEIGKVIEVINSIAEQTNLLALNATIEAARAGEAGKGFAVVANEVKELAKETASATQEIKSRIENIQRDSESAVGAMGEIANIISTINTMQSTIAVAVEEQTATTGEISRNVSQAAEGSEEVSRSIAHVAAAATDTSKGAVATKEVAFTVTNEAASLKAVLEGVKTSQGSVYSVASDHVLRPRRDFTQAHDRSTPAPEDVARQSVEYIEQ